MNLSIFPCCMTLMNLAGYEASNREVLKALGIELAEKLDFKCCGYPLKNYSFKAFILSAARNLALAQRKSAEMVTMCSCCYGNFKHASHDLAKDQNLKDEINAALGKEGLHYEEGVRVKHFLDVFHDNIGSDHITERIVRPLNGLRVAVHYGCHLLRPRNIVQFDNPFVPAKLDRLVEATGAESIAWSTKLDCCGSPLMGSNAELSMDLTQKKLLSAKEAGADCLCVVCPYCFQQFTRVQDMIAARRGLRFRLPTILFQQLLGFALGIDERSLGIQQGQLLTTILSAA